MPSALSQNGTINSASVVNNATNNATYKTNPGSSMFYVINGTAGNIESHSTFVANESRLPMAAALDLTHFGFSMLTVHNATNRSWKFIEGKVGSIGDSLTVLKDVSYTCSGYAYLGRLERLNPLTLIAHGLTATYTATAFEISSGIRFGRVTERSALIL
jgi:hypothetical protein